jgi:tripartite-type tricarboxylate transporter receptor subunit TctC
VIGGEFMRSKQTIPTGILSSMTVFLVNLLLVVAASPAAEKFPSREITLIVQFAAGGSVDLTARALAEHLRKELGVPVIVENRAEAGGVKGALDVYKAKPDGYTLLANLLPRNAQTEVIYKPPYKLLEMTSLAGFHKMYQLVAVQKDSPNKTLKDLIDASKKKSLNAGITGMGSGSHLLAMILKRKLGMNLEVVPFKGSAPAITALLGGNVDFAPTDVLTAHLHKEKLHPLVVFSEKRLAKFPDTPTIKELGYVNIEPEAAVSTQGISGPPGLSAETRNILSDALARAIKNPELVDRVEKMGPNILYLSGPEFHAVAQSSFKLVEEYKDIFQEQK